MMTLFIGLGRMGAPMVRRYAQEHDTVLYDANHAIARALAAELKVRVVGSLAELSEDVETVILMLPNSRVVESVLVGQGLLDRLRRGSFVIDMGSSDPASTRWLAAAAKERGIGYVDAPVSGGVVKAIRGELSIIVGGYEADVARALPHLRPLGNKVVVVGPPGAGHAAKALNNLLSATNLAAAAEVLTVAKSFGIDPGTMVEVLNVSTGRSQATEVKYPRHVLTGTYDSGFAMDLMIKDIGIAQSLSRDQRLTTPVTDAAADIVIRAKGALGKHDLDHTEVARYYEALNEVSLQVMRHESASERPHRGGGTAVSEDPQNYIDDMARSRGYVLDYHKVMARQDFRVLQAVNGLVAAAYLDQRSLDRKIKELIFIVSLTVMRAGKEHIQSHIRVGLDLGLTPREILEAIEISLPEAGIVAFQAGFDAWREVVGAEGIEPTVRVHEGGSGA